MRLEGAPLWLILFFMVYIALFQHPEKYEEVIENSKAAKMQAIEDAYKNKEITRDEYERKVILQEEGFFSDDGCDKDPKTGTCKEKISAKKIINSIQIQDNKIQLSKGEKLSIKNSVQVATSAFYGVKQALEVIQQTKEPIVIEKIIGLNDEIIGCGTHIKFKTTVSEVPGGSDITDVSVFKPASKESMIDLQELTVEERNESMERFAKMPDFRTDEEKKEDKKLKNDVKILDDELIIGENMIASYLEPALLGIRTDGNATMYVPEEYTETGQMENHAVHDFEIVKNGFKTEEFFIDIGYGKMSTDFIRRNPLVCNKIVDFNFFIPIDGDGSQGMVKNEDGGKSSYFLEKKFTVNPKTPIEMQIIASLIQLYPTITMMTKNKELIKFLYLSQKKEQTILNSLKNKEYYKIHFSYVAPGFSQ